MNYNFPKIKYADINLADEQLQHFATECREIAERIEKGDYPGMVEETLDMMHSGETFLRIAEKHGVDVDREVERVIQKNADRGYYGKTTEG